MNLLIAPMNTELQISRIRNGRGKGKGGGMGHGPGPCENKGCCNENSETGNQHRHLSNLGFVEDAKIEVVSETCGNLIVKVKDSKIAIGKDIAKKIIVKPCV